MLSVTLTLLERGQENGKHSDFNKADARTDAETVSQMGACSWCVHMRTVLWWWETKFTKWIHLLLNISSCFPFVLHFAFIRIWKPLHATQRPKKPSIRVDMIKDVPNTVDQSRPWTHHHIHTDVIPLLGSPLSVIGERGSQHRASISLWSR